MASKFDFSVVRDSQLTLKHIREGDQVLSLQVKDSITQMKFAKSNENHLLVSSWDKVNGCLTYRVCNYLISTKTKVFVLGLTKTLCLIHAL